MITIKITEEVVSAEKMEQVLEEIVRLLREGYTSGHNPGWTLTTEV
ncbi:MAG: hypothetical protein WBC83_03355 [Minisyncoccia bacterium]